MATSLKSFVSKICFPKLFHNLFPKSDFDLFLDVFWMVFWWQIKGASNDKNSYWGVNSIPLPGGHPEIYMVDDDPYEFPGEHGDCEDDCSDDDGCT